MATLLTPVGRLVAGSVYTPNTTDWQGAPLVIKTGPNAGQPRTEFFFALAIPKAGEQSWAETPWGQAIYQAALTGFPNGEPQRPDFAWKITDGDSQVPNKRGVMPCTKDGYPGHWVMGFSSSFAPKLYTMAGGLQAPAQLLEPDAIQNGYFVQISGTVEPNGIPGNPGVYLNHNMVCLQGYGQVIQSGPDVATVGFGGAALPAGATATPPAGSFNPAVPGQPGAVPGAMPGVQPGVAMPGAAVLPTAAVVPGATQPMAAAAQYVTPQTAVPGASAAAAVPGGPLTPESLLPPGYVAPQ